MDIKQAIDIIKQATAQINTTLDNHQKIQLAIQVIEEKVKE